MLCYNVISRADLKSLAHADTLTRYGFPHLELTILRRSANRDRYDLKLTDTTRRFCQDRCPKSRAFGLQAHDRTTDDRVFTCQFCDFATCIDCDRPEHIGETCYEYRTRVIFAPQHVKAHAATWNKYKMCPACDSVFELEKGHGCYLMCACGYRFCEKKCCLIPWVGEDSAYLLGKAGHHEGCKYRERDDPSIHTLKNRFEERDEVKDRLAKKKLQQKMKREAKKMAKLAEIESGEVKEEKVVKKPRARASTKKIDRTLLWGAG